MKHPAGWIVVTRRHPGSASVCAAVACGGVICGCRANLLGLPPGRTLRLKAWKPAGFHEFKGDHKMARTINCSECGKYLGNLATGSRGRKGTTFLCSGCRHQRILQKTSGYGGNVPDFLKGFGVKQ